MAFIRAITHQEPYTLELPFTGANCEHKWIRATGKIRYTHQIATHVYGSFEDISERKNILASEKYTSKYLKNLVDNIDDCIITIFANGTICSVNNEVKKSFGYSLDELIGQNISKLILKPFSSSHDRCKDKQLQTDITKIIGTCRELTLEITENALIADFDLVISKMEFLKQKGIHFSIDDFGTGYSSLSYIHHLPISELKIDKYFVDDIKNAVDEVPIINTIIQLAKSLNLKVVAKGGC
jgi:transcriptional regulator with PAS, ATPase and Fis domain